MSKPARFVQHFDRTPTCDRQTDTGLAISSANIYIYIFPIEYIEAILSNCTRKLYWHELSKMLIAVLKEDKFIVLFIIIFGTLSFPIVPPGKKTDFSITDTECRIFFSKVPWLVIKTFSQSVSQYRRGRNERN